MLGQQLGEGGQRERRGNQLLSRSAVPGQEPNQPATHYLGQGGQGEQAQHGGQIHGCSGGGKRAFTQ